MCTRRHPSYRSVPKLLVTVTVTVTRDPKSENLQAAQVRLPSGIRDSDGRQLDKPQSSTQSDIHTSDTGRKY